MRPKNKFEFKENCLFLTNSNHGPGQLLLFSLCPGSGIQRKPVKCFIGISFCIACTGPSGMAFVSGLFHSNIAYFNENDICEFGSNFSFFQN